MHEMSGYPSLLEPCRRRLPATPSRRSSSPRMLPTPPPPAVVSPDFRPPSSLLERRPSGRKLPMPPPTAATSNTHTSTHTSAHTNTNTYTTSSSVSDASDAMDTMDAADSEWPPPILSSPIITQRKFSEMRESSSFAPLLCSSSSYSSSPHSTTSTSPLHSLTALLTHHHQRASLDQSSSIVTVSSSSSSSTPCSGATATNVAVAAGAGVGVGATNVAAGVGAATGTSGTNAPPSQSSSVSHSIEQLTTTSKSSSDTEEHPSAAHGINPTLYHQSSTIATSSSSVPDIANSIAVPTSSSWPENEPRPTGLGLIHCSLQHFPIRKRLRVSILKAEGLAGQLKPELEIHAFCKLSILPGGKSQNSIVKRGRDVVFNQEFFFDGISIDDLNEKCLSITVCHQSMQKLQKDVIIGDLYLPLKNLNELRTKKEVRVIEELKHRMNSKKLGKIHISSCIEKDARRLTITLNKADDLPKGGITGPPDVCVRIKVTQGGMSQTKQSRVLKSTCCAVYKEAVMFLINTKLNELQQTSIIISVHDLSRTTTGDDLIGSAFLGISAMDKSEVEQWKNTIEHQGKEYKGVHHLKPVQRAPDVHVAEAPSDSD